MIKNFLTTVFCVFAAFTIIPAQAEDIAGKQRAEVKKLESMVGQWKGSGWIQQGSKRETFTGTETVQRKIDGLALLVEGKFASPEGKIIHETLAILAFNPKESKYRFRTYLANGMSGEHDFHLLDGSYQWGFQNQMGTVRYTIKTDNDVWFEIGEFSRDGKTWMQIFEMTLNRVK